MPDVADRVRGVFSLRQSSRLRMRQYCAGQQSGGRCLRRSVISSRRPARPESIPDQQLGILAAAAARENHVAHEGDGLRPGPGPRRIDKM
jgi:hypothetical protein